MNCNIFSVGKKVRFKHGKGIIHCEVLSFNKREVKVKILDFENFKGYSKKHWSGTTKTLPVNNKYWDTADGNKYSHTEILGGVPVFAFTGNDFTEFHRVNIPKKMEGFQFDYMLCKHIANTINYRGVTGRIKPMIIDGLPGTGKTETVRQVFNMLNRPLVEIGCNGRTSMSHLVGRRDLLADGTTGFTYGVLPRAMKLGMGILLDEFDAAPADVNLILHSVAQDGILFIPELNEMIRAHKDFCIFATGNTFTCSEDEMDKFERNDQDEATKRRFFIYRVNPLSEDLMLKGIYEGTDLSYSKTKKIIEVIKKINGHKSLKVYLTMREMKRWANEFQFYGNDPLLAAEGCIINLFREENERKLVTDIIKNEFK